MGKSFPERSLWVKLISLKKTTYMLEKIKLHAEQLIS